MEKIILSPRNREEEREIREFIKRKNIRAEKLANYMKQVKAFDQSLKEVKLIREGKLKGRDPRQTLKEL